MILVSQEGRLVGLVTVKDVLRHEAIAHHHRASHVKPSSTMGPTHGHSRDSSWGNGWNDDWQEVVDVDIRGNGLEYALEVALAWVRQRADGLRGLVNSRRGSRRRDLAGDPGGDNPAYEYELSDNRPA